jgi:3',5'-cyclic AMP phosphodiesterase CpdA
MFLRTDRLISFFFMASVLPLLCFAQEDIHKIEIRNAALAPERILLNITADAAHSQTVTWRTETPLGAASAQIAEATPHPDFVLHTTSVAATAIRFDTGKGHLVGEYAATFTSLKPATRYAYRVGDDKAWSEWLEFRTAAEKPQSFRFIYLGDAQNAIRSQWSRAVRAAYAAAPDAAFIAHAGDLVAEGYDDTLWGEWFDAQGFIGGTIPSFPVPGNHDHHRGAGMNEIYDTPANWRAQFSLPHNGPASVPELDQLSYYFDYQGVRFIALDVNVYANESFRASERERVGAAQAVWLEKVLSENPNPWTIVIQHQPLFTVSKGRDYVEMRKVLEPIYDKYHVDLVLEGHDHAYARSFPLMNGKTVESGQGPVYVISVSGPKMYAADSNNRERYAVELRNTQLYQIIDISPDRLDYRAFDIEGKLMDKFSIDRASKATVRQQTR